MNGSQQLFRYKSSAALLTAYHHSLAFTWRQRLGIMWTPPNLLFLAALMTVCHAASQPSVRLGDTRLIGSSLQPANLEFFGGDRSPILIRYLPHPSLAGIPFAEPPVGSLRFSPPKPKYSLSPLKSFDASNFGNPCLQPVNHLSSPLCGVKTHFAFHSNGTRICQRTVLR